MSFRACLILVLISFNFAAAGPARAADVSLHSTKEELLAYKMHKKGTRHSVEAESFKALQRLAQDLANKLDLECEVETLWEVTLERGNEDCLAGYEIILDCKDAPSPGLSLYFDSESRFLGSFDFGH